MQLPRSLGFLEKSSGGDPQGIWARIDKKSGRNFCSTLLGLASLEANYLRYLGLGLVRMGDAESAQEMLDQALVEAHLS